MSRVRREVTRSCGFVSEATGRLRGDIGFERRLERSLESMKSPAYEDELCRHSHVVHLEVVAKVKQYDGRYQRGE